MQILIVTVFIVFIILILLWLKFVYIKIMCKKTENGDNVLQRCKEIDGLGTIAHNKYCNVFYFCALDRYILLHCSKEHAYNEITGQCEKVETVDCSNRPFFKNL